jgi:hypothetical protein
MHAQADPECRDSGLYPFHERFKKAELPDICNPVTESAHARKNELRRGAYLFRIRGNPYLVPQSPQRILNAAQVVQFVINDRNHFSFVPPLRGWHRHRSGSTGSVGQQLLPPVANIVLPLRGQAREASDTIPATGVSPWFRNANIQSPGGAAQFLQNTLG